jgi:predicted nucleotidyltransferase
MATAEIIEILKRYVKLLNAEGISVHKAYLFGSYSTNTATDSSDIDVMIVSDKYDESDDMAIGRIWKLTRKINTRIEPFMIGIKRFNNEADSPIISMVKKQGIEVA